MPRVQIDWLDGGQLPLYHAPEGGEHFYALDEDQTTWNVYRRPNGRVLITIGIDAPLVALEQRLPELLNTFAGEDGTYILAIRTCADIPFSQSMLYDQTSATTNSPLIWPNPLPATALLRTDTTSSTTAVPEMTYRLVLAGLAFVPGCILGTETANPAEVMIEALRSGWPTTDPMVGQHDAAILAAHERYLAQMSARRKKQDECEARARGILLEFLDQKQRAEFEEYKRFRVQGQDGYRYVIEHKFAHNVYRIEGETKVVEYCLVSTGHVPIYDLMLTQKLLLESNPEPFFAKANVWQLDEKGQRALVTRAPQPYFNPENMELVIPDLIGDLPPDEP